MSMTPGLASLGQIDHCEGLPPQNVEPEPALSAQAYLVSRPQNDVADLGLNAGQGTSTLPHQQPGLHPGPIREPAPAELRAIDMGSSRAPTSHYLWEQARRPHSDC